MGKKTYFVKTLGCQMNAHDSEQMALVLENRGYIEHNTNKPFPDSDVVVVNTCAVRENAVSKLFGFLGHMAQVKRENPKMKIAVGGCYAQSFKDIIYKKAPWVDIVFGTQNIAELGILLDKSLKSNKKEFNIVDFNAKEQSINEYKNTNNSSAYLNISTGCNNKCTYCIVPQLRGKEKDESPSDIIKQATELVEKGAVEITLLGQNVNSYGVEFGDAKAFSKLIAKIGVIPGLKRLRFTSPHPANFTNDVIGVMKDTPTIMPALHMPLQSGSTKVLKDMKRSYTQNSYLKLIDRAKREIENISITTDVIVGFPTETEQDFMQTIKVIKEVRFAMAYTFIFSPRPNTPAAKLPELDKTIVQQRFDKLLKIQNQISYEENQKLIGTTQEVLTFGKTGRKDFLHNTITGRTKCNRLVHVDVQDSNNATMDANFINVKIDSAAPFFLRATPV